MLEKTIIEMLKEIPMPRRVKFANTFLRMSDFDSSSIISTMDRGINFLRHEFEHLAKAHHLTDYENAERLDNLYANRDSDEAMILPKSRIRILAEELFSLLSEYGLYLQQANKYKGSMRFRDDPYSPQELDRGLVDCLSALNNIGWPCPSTTRENLLYPIQNKKTFFWHERKRHYFRTDKQRGIDIIEYSYYPCLGGYCREARLLLDDMQNNGYDVEKEIRKIPKKYREIGGK